MSANELKRKEFESQVILLICKKERLLAQINGIDDKIKVWNDKLAKMDKPETSDK